MKPDLQALLAYWLRALRLQDWRVSIEYVRGLCDPKGSPVWAQCWPLVDNKTARIQVRDPETPVGNQAGPSIEERVVHEVSHLHFAAFGTRTPAEIAAEEQAVWAFSEALVREKGTPRGAALARAMAVRGAMVGVAVAARRQRMDPMILAALEACLEAADPKAAIQALLEKMKAIGGGDAPPAAGAASVPAEDPNKSPMGARAASAAPALTAGDVVRLVREETAKAELISAARSSRVGFTDQLAAHCSGVSLADARAIVGALAAAPAGTAAVQRASLAEAQVEQAAAPSLDDQIAIRHLDQIFAGVVPVPDRNAAAAPATPKAAAAAPATPARKPGSWSLKDLDAIRQAGKGGQKGGA